MVGLLASVAGLDEAEIAAGEGADLVDLKDPARGALGAWPEAAISRAVDRLGSRTLLSATVGDLPMQPKLVLDAARRTAATGVHFVKLGFFAGGDPSGCAQALAMLAGSGVRLVAVLMADQSPRLELVGELARSGFAGVMLDTADKSSGGLRRHQSEAELRRFVAIAREHALLCGLAGSLTPEDIAPLAALGPDYLGFRGALCRAADRTGRLDPARLNSLRQALVAASRQATATAGRQPPTARSSPGSAAGTRLAAGR
jgi:(5-formylfuran-3-yl)methyl phosphate synthase